MKRVIRKEKKVPKIYKFDIDHNPYEVLSYNNTSGLGRVVVFPIFHYEGERQYMDLLNPIIEKGFHVVIIKLLGRADRVLFFNYYYSVLSRLLSDLIANKIIKNEQIIFMGFGVGAYLASYMQTLKLKGITKFLLISPVNKFKDEYVLSNEIEHFKIPTYIFFGQNDSVVNVDTRFAIYENGRKNPKVVFSSYAVNGHYLYYKDVMSIDVEETYRKSGYNLLIGENSRTRSSYLPENVEYNTKFYDHIFKILDDEPLPKRIGLITDVFPVFDNEVSIVVGKLQEELNKLGNETYVISLWEKGEQFNRYHNDYIPLLGNPIRFTNDLKELHLLKPISQKNAKVLALFGFDYLHLHTEYSLAPTALLLSKYTGIKMAYTYHPLWKVYYECKANHFAYDINYQLVKELALNKAFKESNTVITPSKKSYEILSLESRSKDIRVLPNPIDVESYKFNKNDLNEVKKLREKYKLKDKKVLGYVSRVGLDKNIVELLKNISEIKDEIPNILLMIVNVSDANKLLKKTIKKLGIENYVLYVDEVKEDKLKYYYSLFDVFMSNTNFETQWKSYFEAASVGSLILAKKDKALEGIFEDGVNCYLYSDFYSWVEKIEKALFSNNKKVIDNAKNLMKQYTPEKNAKQLLTIYQEINGVKEKTRTRK